MPKIIWLLIAGMSTNVIASSFLWPLNTIYIHQHLGEPLAAAGFVLMMNAGASIVGNLFGGKLFDRIGGYKTLIIGLLIAMTSAIFLAFFHDYYQYMAFLTGIGFGHGIVVPCFYSMAGSIWPQGGRRPFNAMYVAQNVGVSAGTALAGLVASFNMEFIFIANSVTYLLLFAFAVIAFRRVQKYSLHVKEAAAMQEISRRQGNLLPLAVVAVGFFICWLGYVQWLSNISVHMQDLDVGLQNYSLLWTINGFLIVAMQPIMALVVRRWVKSLKAQLMVGVVVFFFSYVMLLQAEVFAGFLVAMLILTVGELFVWPAVPTIAFRLAPKGKEGAYQGFVNSIASAGRMIGPLIGGLIADLFHMHALFMLLLFLYVIAFASVSVYDRFLTNEERDRLN